MPAHQMQALSVNSMQDQAPAGSCAACMACMLRCSSSSGLTQQPHGVGPKDEGGQVAEAGEDGAHRDADVAGLRTGWEIREIGSCICRKCGCVGMVDGMQPP